MEHYKAQELQNDIIKEKSNSILIEMTTGSHSVGSLGLNKNKSSKKEDEKSGMGSLFSGLRSGFFKK